MRAFLCLCAVIVATCGRTQPTLPMLIPAPVNMVAGEGGDLTLRASGTVIVADTTLRQEAVFLQHTLAAAGIQADLVAERTGKEAALQLGIVPANTLPPGGYSLRITAEGAVIDGADGAGVLHGIQTFTQVLEQASAAIDGTGKRLVGVTVTDHPRFGWRGMHLDVCRHFFPVDFIKKYIDLLTRYKMNSFHWHLTDDQGWRIPIKKYPKLTEVGAWRSGSQVGPYSRREYDSTRYGGFYTQEEIRDVVAYATARHINVVPEIEMPGHALAALAAYPQYSCTGGPFAVEKGWGVFPDVFCPGNDSTFTFLEDVLDEVIALFPSPYIHIGGDECPHERWEKCARCQALMKKEGLKSTDELQSYFIRRIERHVNAKGRKIIGWDEILQGGLAPNATVMSWTGIDGGIAAAKNGHDAVMSPGSHCYFDHYQGDPANEPLAIGGFTPVQKVYGYEPVPDDLTADQATHILGAQGNIWTEYILTPEHVEYMALPRMAALAEVLWTPKAQRNEQDFIRRLEQEFHHLDALGIDASKSLYQVMLKVEPAGRPGELKVVPSAGMSTCSPVVVMDPIPDGNIRVDTEVTACCADNNDRSTWMGANTRLSIHFNKATARAITLSVPPHERYDDGGAFTLVNGISAQQKRVNHEWIGWRSDVDVTVDLGDAQALSSISIGALHEVHSWIHAPERVVISTSLDGKTYTPLATVPRPADAKGRTAFGTDISVKARFVRFAAKAVGRIPEGLAGAGNPAWLFLDEVVVR